MPSTYILRDDANKIYIGSCIEMNKRFNDHLNHNTKTTKKFINPKIVWIKNFESIGEARALERKIKKWKSRKMMNLLIEGTIKL